MQDMRSEMCLVLESLGIRSKSITMKSRRRRWRSAPASRRWCSAPTGCSCRST
jgi:hypothetical protein